MDEHVSRAHKFLQRALARLALEVDGNGPLVAVQRNIERSHRLRFWRLALRTLPVSRRLLDLDDISPKVTQCLRRIRPKHILGQVDDPHPSQGTGTGRAFRRHGIALF
jgi:hypothetical protein